VVSGSALPKEFKNEGAKGVIVGRNQETLDSAVAQLGGNFIAINADVTTLPTWKGVCSNSLKNLVK